jgi:hypothetical protein
MTKPEIIATCKVVGEVKSKMLTINCRHEDKKGKIHMLAAKELVTFGAGISKNHDGNLVGISDTGEVDVCVPDGSKIKCARIDTGRNKCVVDSNVGNKLVIKMFPHVPVAPPKMATEAISILKSGKKCE